MQLGQFGFADATFSATFDNFSDTVKLRKTGFEGQVNLGFRGGLLNKLATLKILAQPRSLLGALRIAPGFSSNPKSLYCWEH